MTTELNLPKTLQEAIEAFADPDYAHRVAASFVWPDGQPTCPKCGGKKSYFLKRYYRYECAGCKHQFTVKVGTIFEDSPIPLSKWMMAMWMIANCKNGCSSYEIHRAIGVTQRTAWFMGHRLRSAMTVAWLDKISGEVEADETFIGGKEKFKHNHKKQKKGRGAVGKLIVMGLLERGSGSAKSRVRVKLVKSTRKAALQTLIRSQVTAGSAVYTDAHKAYMGLDTDYTHAFVDHAVRYTMGRVHTNSLENFWSLFKRTLKGTYIAVQPFHFERYIDEQTWRFDNRSFKDGERFLMALSSIAGKRLDYATLTSSFKRHRDEFGLN